MRRQIAPPGASASTLFPLWRTWRVAEAPGGTFRQLSLLLSEVSTRTGPEALWTPWRGSAHRWRCDSSLPRGVCVPRRAPAADLQMLTAGLCARDDAMGERFSGR